MSLSNQVPIEEYTKTAFTHLIPQFPNASEKIRTGEFLEAAAGAVSLVERFGKVFSSITYDMNGNIKKLQKRYDEDKESHEYLEDMILKEQAEGEAIATDALMWLRRALHFQCNFYQSIIDDTLSERCSNDLAPFLKRAYLETLEQYHGWLGTQLFNVLSRFAPDRKNFIFSLALAHHHEDQGVIEDMQSYNVKLTACVRKLSEFYLTYGLESFVTV